MPALPWAIVRSRLSPQFLVPGGKILLTTACRGGTPSGAVLSFWGAVTEQCGPLPLPGELLDQLAQAGYVEGKANNLMAPFEQYYAFSALRR